MMLRLAHTSLALVLGTFACHTPTAPPVDAEPTAAPEPKPEPEKSSPRAELPCQPGERMATFTYDERVAVSGVGFSPSGELFVTYIYGNRSPPTLWDGWSFDKVQDLPPVMGLPYHSPVLFLSERQFIVLNPLDAYLLDLDSGQVLARYDTDPELHEAHLSPSRELLLLTIHQPGVPMDDVRVVNPTSGEILGTMKNQLWTFAISPHEDLLIVRDRKRRPMVHELPSGRLLGPLAPDHPWQDALGMVFLPDGETVAVHDYDAGQLVFTTIDGGVFEIGEVPAVNGSPFLHEIVLTPDGRRIIGSSHGDLGWVWDIEQKKVVFTFGSPRRYMTVMALTPDGERLFVGETDGAIREFDMDSGVELGVFESHVGPPSSFDSILNLSVSPDGTRLAAGYRPGASVWCIAEPEG